MILGVLLVISIVPMYFYSAQVEAINRDRLKTNEMLLQNTVTRSLADDLSQHERSLRMMLANLSSAIQISSGGDIGSQNIEVPELRALLENFVSSSDELAYATLLNSDAKGISAGRIVPDAFLQRELERAFAAARDGRAYNGQALTIGNGAAQRTVLLVSSPVSYGGRFLGMVGAVVDLQFLIRRLQEVSRGGLIPYVIDAQGRLVAAGTPQYATGQDMKSLEIVRNFVDEGNKPQVAATKEFTVREGKDAVEMLGTYSPVTALDWAVVVQKPRREAYRGVYEMQRTARLLAIMAVLLSISTASFPSRTVNSLVAAACGLLPSSTKLRTISRLFMSWPVAYCAAYPQPPGGPGRRSHKESARLGLPPAGAGHQKLQVHHRAHHAKEAPAIADRAAYQQHRALRRPVSRSSPFPL